MSNGKGSKRRPRQVPQQTMDENWEAVFGPRRNFLDVGAELDELERLVGKTHIRKRQEDDE